MNDLIKEDCKALEEILWCCEKGVVTTYDNSTNSYNVRCKRCKKEVKSSSLTKIIFNWNKK
jgi:hypothetical protein